MNTLQTGILNTKNVQRYIFNAGSIDMLDEILDLRRVSELSRVIFFVDEFHKPYVDARKLITTKSLDRIYFVPTSDEPTTDLIDDYITDIINGKVFDICALVAIGGGITMDIAKAVSNLLTNGGKAEDYQGWDLVKKPGMFKVAIPTLSGTGAEATRTCVMTNKKTGLKLGMNSDYTVFDQIIMDPNLTKTVPKNQYFYTGMDAYIHCIESINGSFRNAVGDSFSAQTISQCRDVFKSNDMMSDRNRSKMMVASYLGGCAIATSYVGVVHPFSAGLSVVLGTHHCIANCITMRAMEEFYPEEYLEFWQMVEIQKVEIPTGICQNLSSEQYDQLYSATVVHEKPLTNALGENFKDILTKQKVIEIFRRM